MSWADVWFEIVVPAFVVLAVVVGGGIFVAYVIGERGRGR